MTDESVPRWVHFSEGEMACSHCGMHPMDEGFMKHLNELRNKVGFPLVISSGYRCPEYNAKVSFTGTNGPHTTGMAADIAISGEKAFMVAKAAFQLGFKGIGIAQKGVKRFIHVDDVVSPEHPRPRVWSY